MVRLNGLEGRYPRQLSGGQQQRVALARALVINPAVLLLDEPMGALDKNLRESMQFELKRIQRQLGPTTIIVTHDQEEALTLSSRVAVMKDGRILQYGDPKSIYNRPRSQFVAEFLGAANVFVGVVTEMLPRLRARAVVKAQKDLSFIFSYADSPPVRIGQSVTCALRPERIFLTDEMPSTENCHRVSILDGVFRGQSKLYEACIEGLDVPIQVLTGDDFGIQGMLSTGAHVWASWSPEVMVLLEPDQ
jgi:ABC-type Fe3+/spermidine/putrescine transport system ATPase subunit